MNLRLSVLFLLSIDVLSYLHTSISRRGSIFPSEVNFKHLTNPHRTSRTTTRCNVSLKDYQEKYIKIIFSQLKKFFVVSSLLTSLGTPRALRVTSASASSKEAIVAPQKQGYHKVQEDNKVEVDQLASSFHRDLIRQHGTSFIREAVKVVGPSVVRIDCEREVPNIATIFTPSDGFRDVEVVKISGSGFVISKDGYIITNAHVVQDSKKITMTLSNDRTFKAKVVAFDELTDIALLAAEVDEGVALTPAPLGDSSKLQSGDWVIAVGCPVGLDFTVTLGIVSNPKRSSVEVGVPYLKGNYIQTDAALNSGNSGGPLVDDKGHVIGINTMVRTNTEAIGFAIPINRVKEIYDILKQGKKPTHAYFGLEVVSLTPDNAKIHNDDPNAIRLPEIHGALIVRVIPNSPAALSGIRKSDVIMEINGRAIASSADAEAYLDICKPGEVVKLRISRGENANPIEIKAKPEDLLQVMEEKKRRAIMSVLKPQLPAQGSDN